MGVNSFFWGSSRDCPGLSGAVNNYSWQNARDNELLGLTAFSRSARQAALSDMFGDLGQVMHLLEDTTSPQHIRNEQHLTFHYFPLPWASPIEEWGMANVGSLNYQQDMLDWYGAGFTKLEDFWDRHLYNGNSSAALNAAESEGGTQLGLAEWCNGNFLGVRHSYAEYYQPHSIQWYPFPSRNHSTDYLQVRSHLDSAVHNLTLKNGYQGHAYYLQKTGDGITSLPDETPFLHHSRFTYFGGRFPYYGMITVDDPNVLNDYHAALIPKAVKYSAGLLDYFFREQIEVGAAVDSGEYTVNVINSSIQPFSGGSFYLFKEDPSGNRSLVQQNDLGGILPAGGHLQFIYDDDSLSGPTRFILVYKGTIGVGGGQPLDPVDANIGIAAQIFTLDPIQGCIDCGGCNFWPCQD
jgi:hypothetical protein